MCATTPDTADLTAWAAAEGLPIIGIDNRCQARRGAAGTHRAAAPLRPACSGRRGRASPRSAREHASLVCSIAQFGSSTVHQRGRRQRRSRCTPWIQRHADVPDPRDAG
ncbi:rRNA methyltransferase [Streptomyces californicus]